MKLKCVLLLSFTMILSGCLGSFGDFGINLDSPEEIAAQNMIVRSGEPFEIPPGNVILKIDELKMENDAIIKAKDGRRKVIIIAKRMVLEGDRFFINSYSEVTGENSPDLELRIHKIEITATESVEFLVSAKGAKGATGATGRAGHNGRDASCTGSGAGNGSNGKPGGKGGKGGNGGNLVIKYRSTNGFNLAASSLGGAGGNGGPGGPGGRGGAGKDCGLWRRGSGNNGSSGATGPQGENGQDGSIEVTEYSTFQYYFGF